MPICWSATPVFAMPAQGYYIDCRHASYAADIFRQPLRRPFIAYAMMPADAAFTRRAAARSARDELLRACAHAARELLRDATPARRRAADSPFYTARATCYATCCYAARCTIARRRRVIAPCRERLLPMLQWRWRACAAHAVASTARHGANAHHPCRGAARKARNTRCQAARGMRHSRYAYRRVALPRVIYVDDGGLARNRGRRQRSASAPICYAHAPRDMRPKWRCRRA